MAFHVGKREKIFVGVVGLVLAIAALHLLVFKPAHDSYLEAKTKFEAEQAKQGKRTPQDYKQQEAQYQAETEKLKKVIGAAAAGFPKLSSPLVIEFQKVAEGPFAAAKAAYVPLYMGSSATPNPVIKLQYNSIWPKLLEYAPYKEEDEIAKKLTEAVNELLKVKASGAGTTQFPFLDVDLHPGSIDMRWRLLDRLPKNIMQGTPNLKDVLRELEAANNQVGMSPSGLAEWQNNYLIQLQILTGVTYDEWRNVVQRWGDAVYSLSMLKLIEVIIERTAVDGKSEYTPQRLREILRVSLDPIECYHIHQQLMALAEVMKAAQKSGVDEFLGVKLYKSTPMYFDETWPKETVLEPGTTPAATASASPTPQQAAAMPGMPGMPGMMPGMYGGPGGYAGYGYSYAAGGAVATPSTLVEVAELAPVEVTFKGSNQAVARFLYDVANLPRKIDVDRLEFYSSQYVSGGAESGKIYASAKLGFVTYVK